MPRKAEELGALQVAAITTPGLHAVGGVAGPCLQVEPTGGRGWVLHVMVAGKRRFMGLGGLGMDNSPQEYRRVMRFMIVVSVIVFIAYMALTLAGVIPLDLS